MSTEPAILAAAVAFIIFLLTRIAEIIGHWMTARNVRRRLATGIFAEIRSNLRTIEAFLDHMPYPEEIRNKVKSENNFRPLMTIEETTHFFDSNTSNLPVLESTCLLAVAGFYRQIQQMNAVKQAFESNAFLTISPEGRASTVDDLWLFGRRAEKMGWKALYELELAYPRPWFTQFRS